MKIEIHGSMGDELGYTAAVRELKRQRPEEMIRLHGRWNPEIWMNCPFTGIGNVDDGRILHVYSFERRTRETANSRTRYSMRMLGVDLTRVEDEYPEFWFTEKEIASPIMVSVTRSPRDTRRGPLDQLLPTGLERVIAIDPGAGWPTRVWPDEKFSALSERLAERGFVVIQVGSQGKRALRGIRHNLVGRLKLRGVARFLHRCALYIGNDSGYFHVAAAVGCPQVIVYGVSRYGAAPYPSTVAVEPPFECDPTCLIKCGRRLPGEVQIRHCMEEIPVDQVEAAVLEALARPRPPSRLVPAPTKAEVYRRLSAGSREILRVGPG